MKTTLKNKMLIAIAVISIGTAVAGKDGKNVKTPKNNKKSTVDTSSAKTPIMVYDNCLQVEIKASANNEALSGVIYKLYDGNDIVSVINTELLDKPFRTFLLKRDKQYAIEIYKKGYSKKLVKIDTSIPASFDLLNFPLYEYSLEIDLLKEEEVKEFDSFYLDFPIAIVKYNEESDLFNYNAIYTRNIVADLKGE